MNKMKFFIRPYVMHVALAIVASVVCSMASVWMVDILKQLIESVSEGRLKEVFLAIIIKAIGVSALGLVAKYCLVKMMGLFQEGILRDMRRDTIEHIMKCSPNFMENNNFGDIMERISSDISDISLYMQAYLKDCIYVPIIVVAYTLYLFSVNALLASASLIPPLIMVPLSIWLLKPVKRAQVAYSKRIGYLNNNIKEAFDGVSVIKAYGLQRVMGRKYREELQVALDISKDNDLRQYNIEPLSRLIKELPIATALCLGGFLAINGQITMGVLVAFISSIKKINQPLTYAYQLVVKTQMALVSIERVLDIFNFPIEEDERKATHLNKKSNTAIELAHVGYRYPAIVGTNRFTLDSISFKVKRNQNIAILGKSGCGKSTIVKLLCRQYEPDEGEIYIYGNKYAELAPECIRDEISLISQETTIFPFSVMDNIAIGKIGASREEIIDASIKAGCHEFIKNMPDGYDTLLDEKGNNLSGGQRQRLSIARAILKDTSIMILDEPTSALDAGTEQYVIEALESITRDKTVITVTHRLETIVGYDQVIVMRDGKIMKTDLSVKDRSSVMDVSNLAYVER